MRRSKRSSVGIIHIPHRKVNDILNVFHRQDYFGVGVVVLV
jgi:hypothetical protein